MPHFEACKPGFAVGLFHWSPTFGNVATILALVYSARYCSRWKSFSGTITNDLPASFTVWAAVVSFIWDGSGPIN